jgi:hypothetical protein
MSSEVVAEDGLELHALTARDLDEEKVAEQLQRLYECVLNDRRPEAVGATEQLADQLGVRVERPDGFPRRARR